MSNSNPSLPAVPMALSSPPLRRARADPDDDDEDALEEGELRVPVPGGQQHESSDSDDDTEDDNDEDDGRRYRFQPRVPEAVRHPRRRSPRPHHRLDALDILLLGPGAGSPLTSPTPSGECESDATLSDDDHGRGSNPTGSCSSAGFSSSVAVAATAAADAVGCGWGWAATGKRGWKPAAVVVAHAPTTPVVSDLNTVSPGDGHAGITTSIAQQATAHHHQPPLQAQPPRAPQQPPPPRRERATEYTCKECGKSYPTNQALGGHAAGHKNKRREAEAMAAAMAAAAAGDGDAAAFLPLRRGGGKADEPHECRKCGKLFATGVALGGHMRVHYTGPPIVPARKNKKRCLAPPPPQTAEGDIVAAAPPVGLSLALSIKTEDEPPKTAPAAAPAGEAIRVVRLFGIDISPEVQAPLQQLQQGSGGTTEDSSSSTGQQQH